MLHDLHESVPYLYDNTVGDGPYNAWIDPILADEWQMIGWNNVAEMTKFGMPGVFTHGTFDTWSPGYLMFIAALAQRHQPAVRDVRQRRRRHGRAHAVAGRVRAHVVQAEPAAAEGDVVAAQQQQLSADRAARRRSTHFAQNRQSVPAQLLPEEQALDPEGAHGGSGGVRVPGRRSTARRTGRPAAHPAEAGRARFRARLRPSPSRSARSRRAGRRRRPTRAATVRRPQERRTEPADRQAAAQVKGAG